MKSNADARVSRTLRKSIMSYSSVPLPDAFSAVPVSIPVP
jgi:hypothetical protein